MEVLVCVGGRSSVAGGGGGGYDEGRVRFSWGTRRRPSQTVGDTLGVSLAATAGQQGPAPLT